MTNVYDILETVRTEFLASPSITTVSFGELDKVDLDKTTMFPLAHVMINNGVIDAKTIVFNMKILVADIVDYNKKSADNDEFYGNDNLQDVLNTQFNVLNIAVTKMIRGDLFNNLYQVTTTSTAEPFTERFKNELAGWTINLAIEVPNRVSVC